MIPAELAIPSSVLHHGTPPLQVVRLFSNTTTNSSFSSFGCSVRCNPQSTKKDVPKISEWDDKDQILSSMDIYTAAITHIAYLDPAIPDTEISLNRAEGETRRIGIFMRI